MNNTIAVFRSRSATLNYADSLARYMIPHSIINTPQIYQRSCGISVKFPTAYMSQAEMLMRDRQSFVGFFIENINYN